MSEMKRGFKLIEDYVNMKTNLLEYDYKKKEEELAQEESRRQSESARQLEDKAVTQQFEQTLLKTQLEISSKLDILIDLLKITTNKNDSTVKNQNNDGQEREFNPQLDQSQIPYQEGLI